MLYILTLLWAGDPVPETIEGYPHGVVLGSPCLSHIIPDEFGEDVPQLTPNPKGFIYGLLNQIKQLQPCYGGNYRAASVRNYYDESPIINPYKNQFPGQIKIYDSNGTLKEFQILFNKGPRRSIEVTGGKISPDALKSIKTAEGIIRTETGLKDGHFTVVSSESPFNFESTNEGAAFYAAMASALAKKPLPRDLMITGKVDVDGYVHGDNYEASIWHREETLNKFKAAYDAGMQLLAFPYACKNSLETEIPKCFLKALRVVFISEVFDLTKPILQHKLHVPVRRRPTQNKKELVTYIRFPTYQQADQGLESASPMNITIRLRSALKKTNISGSFSESAHLGIQWAENLVRNNYSMPDRFCFDISAPQGLEVDEAWAGFYVAMATALINQQLPSDLVVMGQMEQDGNIFMDKGYPIDVVFQGVYGCFVRTLILPRNIERKFENKIPACFRNELKIHYVSNVKDLMDILFPRYVSCDMCCSLM